MCLKVLCQYPLRMCIAYFRHVLIVIGAEKQGLFIFLMSGFPSECTMKLWCTIKWHWYALWTCKSNPFCENQAIKRHNVWAWLQSTYSFRSRMQVLLPHTDIREVRRSKRTFLILATYAGMWTAEKKEPLQGYYSTSHTGYAFSHHSANVATRCK